MRRAIKQGNATQYTRSLVWLKENGKRTFRVERRCYLSSMPEWIDVYGLGIYKDFADGPIASLQSLARQLIPTLGTEDFFELH